MNAIKHHHPGLKDGLTPKLSGAMDNLLAAHGFESCPLSECRLGFLTQGNGFLAGTLNGYGQVGGIKALSLYATGQSGLTLPLQARPAPGSEVWPSSASPLLPQVREPAAAACVSPRHSNIEIKKRRIRFHSCPRSATFSLGSGPPRRTSSGSVLALRGIASLTETLASPGAYLASTLGLMASSCSDPSVANTSQSADASKAFTSQQERPAPPAPSPTSLLMDAHATLGLMGLVLPRGSSPDVGGIAAERPRSPSLIVTTQNNNNNNNTRSLAEGEGEGGRRSEGEPKPPPIHSK
ncbi:hypothetical protein E2C01_026082 [Portunus trituberculatus]|uniref:Uncharacterized protein n=1 Tax=Portunus trituberculatus TaxID=210409 RepID=A0A5B7EI72_PORTR|nr:hypothetical protein [Portunus trituberculatus]